MAAAYSEWEMLNLLASAGITSFCIHHEARLSELNQFECMLYLVCQTCPAPWLLRGLLCDFGQTSGHFADIVRVERYVVWTLSSFSHVMLNTSLPIALFRAYSRPLSVTG